MNNITNNDLIWDLTQLGFLASFMGLPKESLEIFEGLDAVYENNPGIKNGLGMCYVFAGKYKEAISLYRKQILITDSQNYEARCFLGMALWESGEKEEGRGLVEDALNNGGEDVKIICKTCLESMK